MQLDWELLRIQKFALLEILQDSLNSMHIEAIDGLLNMIDAIQDQAVVQGYSEQQVFGAELA